MEMMEANNLRELLETFYHPRVKKRDITKAGNTIKHYLERLGYSVKISDGFYANIQTECQNPRYIICAHYDSPFLFIKDEYVEWEDRLDFILSRDTLAALVLLLGIGLINYCDKVFEPPFLIVVLLYLFVILTGPYFLTTGTASADDNTTGLVAALILAERLKAHKKQVQFVFFDKEEWGLLGSKNFVKKNKANMTEIKGVLNLDCLGRGEKITLSSQEKGMQENEFRNSFVRFLEQQKVPFLISDQSKCDCKTFRKKGYEAFTIQRKDVIRGTPRLQWIHTNKDTIEAIELEKIEEVLQLTEAYISKIIRQSADG